MCYQRGKESEDGCTKIRIMASLKLKEEFVKL